MSRHDELLHRLRIATGERGEPRAVRWSGRRNGTRTGRGGELPEVVQLYVDKLVRQDQAITEEDLEGLQRAGYSEEAIFELTIAAAIGARPGRLERGAGAPVR